MMMMVMLLVKKSGGRLSAWGDRNSVVVVVFVQQYFFNSKIRTDYAFEPICRCLTFGVNLLALLPASLGKKPISFLLFSLFFSFSLSRCSILGFFSSTQFNRVDNCLATTAYNQPAKTVRHSCSTQSSLIFFLFAVHFTLLYFSVFSSRGLPHIDAIFVL